MATGAFVYAFMTFIDQKKSFAEKEKKDKTTHLQKEFENRFFKLLENLQFIVNQISITTPIEKEQINGKIDADSRHYNSLLITDTESQVKYRIFDNRPINLTGREALHILLVRLLKDLPTMKIDDPWDEGLTDDEGQVLRYEEFYNNYFYLLGHYFRFFYRIMVYIDDSSVLSPVEKKSYADILQAQICTDEMGLIFYNAILNDKAKKKQTGEYKFQKLLDYYQVLENIDTHSVVEVSHLKKYYPRTFKI